MEFLTLVPIRPRRRGERRSLRTFPGASLRPSLAFNPRHRRLSTSTDAFQLHPAAEDTRVPVLSKPVLVRRRKKRFFRVVLEERRGRRRARRDDDDDDDDDAADARARAARLRRRRVALGAPRRRRRRGEEKLPKKRRRRRFRLPRARSPSLVLDRDERRAANAERANGRNREQDGDVTAADATRGDDGEDATRRRRRRRRSARVMSGFLLFFSRY